MNTKTSALAWANIMKMAKESKSNKDNKNTKPTKEKVVKSNV